VTAKERNQKIKEYLGTVISDAKKTNEKSYTELDDYTEMKNLLDFLIPHKSDGYRGVVITAICGMHLNSDYNPLTNFYDCRPRAIFEGGIYYVLEEFKIPTGKSAPLNVAKAQKQLDSSWTEGKRGADKIAAEAAVSYIKLLVNSEKGIYKQLVKYFFLRLDQYAETVRSIEIYEVEPTTESRNNFANRLVHFTLGYPESGTVPQLVVGKLIRFVVENSEKHVKGEAESVFGTNTTSKKPADIWIENEKGIPQVLYEITVKKIDFKRLDDCIHTIRAAQSSENIDINFICRMPIDISSLDLSPRTNTLNYKRQWFNFISINSFIINCINLLTDDELKQYFSELIIFIEEVKRPKKTKDGWNLIFSD